jgi:hypothetical protein
MRLKSEAELEHALFDHWLELRSSRRLDSVLPRCTDWEADHRGTRVGYKTLNYSIRRQLRLPGAHGMGYGIADLVEIYWSVRTKNGKQDPNWRPSLNAHVVELKNARLEMEHVDQLYRYMLALRGALNLGGANSINQPDEKVFVYVRGLLLGPEMSRSVELVGALATHADVSLTVATFTLSPVDGIQINRPVDYERFYNVGIFRVDELRVLGESLIASDALVATRGDWVGS